MAKKNKAAAALGRKGGKRRMASMTKAERSAHARMAVEARWAKQRQANEPTNLPPAA